jgi:hypothetical protein
MKEIWNQMSKRNMTELFLSGSKPASPISSGYTQSMLPFQPHNTGDMFLYTSEGLIQKYK